MPEDAPTVHNAFRVRILPIVDTGEFERQMSDSLGRVMEGLSQRIADAVRDAGLQSVEAQSDGGQDSRENTTSSLAPQAIASTIGEAVERAMDRLGERLETVFLTSLEDRGLERLLAQESGDPEVTMIGREVYDDQAQQAMQDILDQVARIVDILEERED